MPDLLHGVLTTLPFILLLLALFGIRTRISPRGSVFVAVPPERVFDLVDLKDGDRQPRQTGHVAVSLIENTPPVYRMTYVTRHANGMETSNHADFRVAERQRPTRLVLERAGLEGKPENNQLLRITASFAAEGKGTRYRLDHLWGKRPLIAQLLARADLYSGLYRFKAFAETGKSESLSELLINVAVAAFTGILTLAAFGFLFGLETAVILVAALFVHEFGHLLAFRLIGQPWGRMVFLPFLGALAVPRVGYESQAQSVFAALMGPGFSLIIPGLAALAVYNNAPLADVLIVTGLVSALLNLFNLLPVEPLDGGVALRSIFGTLLGDGARWGLLIVSAGITLAGYLGHQPLLLVFGGLAVLGNLKPRTIDAGLRPLTGLEMAISIFGFVAIVGAYITAFVFLAQHR